MFTFGSPPSPSIGEVRPGTICAWIESRILRRSEIAHLEEPEPGLVHHRGSNQPRIRRRQALRLIAESAPIAVIRSAAAERILVRAVICLPVAAMNRSLPVML